MLVIEYWIILGTTSDARVWKFIIIISNINENKNIHLIRPLYYKNYGLRIGYNNRIFYYSRIFCPRKYAVVKMKIYSNNFHSKSTFHWQMSVDWGLWVLYKTWCSYILSLWHIFLSFVVWRVNTISNKLILHTEWRIKNFFTEVMLKYDFVFIPPSV